MTDTGVRFVSFGVPVAVTADGPATLLALQPFLPPLRGPIGAARASRVFHVGRDGAGFSLRSGSRVLSSARSLPRVLGALEWELNLFLARRAKECIFVHAGAVGFEGGAILVPGRSFSGKSTLVAELVRSGAEYLSDEYAVLDPQGRCHPFPRGLSVRGPGGMQRRTAEELGGRTGTSPLPVHLVFVTRYRKGASWAPRPLSAGEAVLALMQNTVAVRSRARETLGVLRAAMAGAAAFEGERDEAAEVAGSLKHLAAGLATEVL